MGRKKKSTFAPPPWFRFYHETLDDPKAQSLPPELFKAWVNLLCIACRNNGKLPEDNIAFLLRMDEKKAAKIIGELIKRGLIDRSSNGLEPHNWTSRQFKSDVSTGRVEEFRERQRNGECNVSNPVSTNVSDGVSSAVSETASETAPETETESETERKKDPPAAAPELPLSTNGADPNGSPEDQFWARVDDLEERNILPRSLMAKLGKAVHGDFDQALDALDASQRARVPKTYLATVVRRIEAENRPPPASPTVGRPAWMIEAENEGYPVTREGKYWRMGTALFNDEGEQVGN